MKKMIVLLIALMLLLNFAYGQDFNAMYKHLEKSEQISFDKMNKILSTDSSTFYIFKTVEVPDSTYDIEAHDKIELMHKFIEIYKEEYLRFIARKMLEEQFKKE